MQMSRVNSTRNANVAFIRRTLDELAPKIEIVSSENLNFKIRKIVQNLTGYESNLVLASNIYMEVDDYGNLTKYEEVMKAVNDVKKFAKRLSRLNSFSGSVNMSITFQYFRLLNIQTFIQSTYMQFITLLFNFYTAYFIEYFNFTTEDTESFWEHFMLFDDIFYGLFLYIYGIQDQMSILLSSRVQLIGLNREALPCGTWMTHDPVNDPDGIYCFGYNAGTRRFDNMPTPVTLSYIESVS
jgi:hypothetical protein